MVMSVPQATPSVTQSSNKMLYCWRGGPYRLFLDSKERTPTHTNTVGSADGLFREAPHIVVSPLRSKKKKSTFKVLLEVQYAETRKKEMLMWNF